MLLGVIQNWVLIEGKGWVLPDVLQKCLKLSYVELFEFSRMKTVLLVQWKEEAYVGAHVGMCIHRSKMYSEFPGKIWFINKLNTRTVHAF